MGQKNSSATRVEPIFEQLLRRDPSGKEWLASLLSLAKRADGTDWLIDTDVGTLERSSFGKHERPLLPPRALLRWLLTGAQNQSATWDASERTNERRRALMEERDPATLEEALRQLEEPELPESAWYVFEGPSYPDVFLQTPELIVVIEGKRTERGPTTSTSWMPVRHQMLRHMDNALEISGRRQVVGFFLVEGSDSDLGATVPPTWTNAVLATTGESALRGSLPHRSERQRQQIADGFLGATTWQTVCRTFEIPFPPVLDRTR